MNINAINLYFSLVSFSLSCCCFCQFFLFIFRHCICIYIVQMSENLFAETLKGMAYAFLWRGK